MKYCIFFFLFCLPFVSINADDNIKLTLLHKNGNKISYQLNKNPKLSFTDSDIVVSIDNIAIDYPLSDILQFSYEDEKPSSVSNVVKDDVIFNFDDKSFSITTSKDCIAILFSTNGSVILKKKIKAGKNKVTLPFINPGIYILSVNGVSTKISKQ